MNLNATAQGRFRNEAAVMQFVDEQLRKLSRVIVLDFISTIEVLLFDYESTNKKNVTDAHKRFQCSVYYSISSIGTAVYSAGLPPSLMVHDIGNPFLLGSSSIC